MATAQMNMRIDASLKSAGDLAIREGGSTPSALVRSVWEYAARNRHKPQAIRELQDFLAGRVSVARPKDASADVADEVEQQVLRGPRLVQDCLLRMGVDLANVEPMTYEEMRAAAFDEEWEGASLA